MTKTLTGYGLLVYVKFKVSGFLNLKINLLYHVYDRFMGGYVVLVMSSCHDKDTDRLWFIGLC